MSIPQNAIPFTLQGRPFLLEIDKFCHPLKVGAGRIIDIADEASPQVVSSLRLAVHNQQNFAAQADGPGAQFAGQGYAGHYCNVPARTDPTIVACSMILSGLRIFDIRDPYQPREVAYFNPLIYPPIYPRPLPAPSAGSPYALSSPAWCRNARKSAAPTSTAVSMWSGSATGPGQTDKARRYSDD